MLTTNKGTETKKTHNIADLPASKHDIISNVKLNSTQPNCSFLFPVSIHLTRVRVDINVKVNRLKLRANIRLNSQMGCIVCFKQKRKQNQSTINYLRILVNDTPTLSLSDLHFRSRRMDASDESLAMYKSENELPKL